MDLRIGIIGLGYWGKALLQYFRELPEVRIVALHSRNPQRASEIDLGEAVFYESQEEMFAKAKLDAVVVSNTPPEHLFSTRLAAERGIHVFCEKPMAASLADCEEMIAVCHKHQVKLMVAFKHRFARAFSYLKNDLERFGNPLWAMYTYPLWKVEDSGWKFVEEGTKGIVVENMVHAIDAMRYLFGDVIRLYAEGDNFVFKNVTPPDSAIINLRFANGAIGAIGGGCTSDRRISREYLDIHFEHGLAQISGKLDQPYFLRTLMREDTFPEEHTFEGSDGVREEIRHFVDCLQTGKEPIVNGMDGKKAVAIALASIESIRSHKPISL
jgi:predicted dehydrogenase